MPKEVAIQVDDVPTILEEDGRCYRCESSAPHVVLLMILNKIELQYDEDVGQATGSGEDQEDFMSNLSRIS